MSEKKEKPKQKPPFPPASEAIRGFADWFHHRRRVLPWREEPTLYRVWISEIMLQQTQVATVVPYFERFMARFPGVEDLAAAPEEEVLRHWAGLGYYSRARNLHKAAKRIVVEGFPTHREGWLNLPGIGPYTAGAIVSIALDQPEPILDGNVERVLSRVYRIPKASPSAKKGLWAAADRWVKSAHADGIHPSVLNQALMELGATLCSPKKPKCPLCPLAAICAGRAEGDPEKYPGKGRAKEWVEVREEVHCVLAEGGRVLLMRQDGSKWRSGLWDLPEKLPDGNELGGELELVATAESRHVVTRHKITRTTRIWKLHPGRYPRTRPVRATPQWRAAEVDARARLQDALSQGRAWVDLDIEDRGDLPVAIGSACMKTLQSVREALVRLG